MKTEEAVAFVAKLREAASKERSGLNIGAEWCTITMIRLRLRSWSRILSKVNVNANLITADEQGIHWNAFGRRRK